MATIGIVLMIVGFLVALVGGIGILIEAFKEHVLWGIGSLLFSPVSLVFVILHWDRAGKPFLLNLGGVVVMFLGVLLGGAGGGAG